MFLSSTDINTTMRHLFLITTTLLLFVCTSCFDKDDDDDEMPVITFASLEDVTFTPGETLEFTINTKEDLTRYHLYIGADRCTNNVYKLELVTKSEYKLKLTLPKSYKKSGEIMNIRNDENIILATGPRLYLNTEPSSTN